MKLKDLEHTVGVIAPAGAMFLIPSGRYPLDGSRPEGSLRNSLKSAKRKLKKANKKLGQTKSDLSYWTQRGVVTGWRVAVNLLTAASIAGEDNLPDISPPDLTGNFVSNSQYDLEEWSWRLLANTPGFEDYYTCEVCGERWPNENKYVCGDCEAEFCGEHRPTLGFYSESAGKFVYYCDDCKSKHE